MDYNKMQNHFIKIKKLLNKNDKNSIILICTIIILICTIIGTFIGLLSFFGIFPIISEDYKESVIMIDRDYHHIGDVNRSFFAKPETEGVEYSNTFILNHLGDKMFISISAQHVDPDLDKSPIYIYLNDQFVDYLNNYYDEESIEFKTIEIEVDNSYFHRGQNKISIISAEEKFKVQDYYTLENGSIIYEYYISNIDDICFKDLKILNMDYI